MTTSTTTPRLSYTADGSTAAFTFNFEIADSSSIAVYVGSTLKTLTTDYTVAFDSGTSGTGTINFVVAPTSGTVTLIRDTNLARGIDFQEGGAFLAATVNAEFDRLSQAVIDSTDKIEKRAILLAEPTTETPTLTLPDAATRANKQLAFDGSGDLQVTSAGSGTVTSIATGTGLTGGPITTTGTIAIDSTVATLTGTQTLTNKTLTAPVISTISNTGTLTLPTLTDTLVGRTTVDTLSNKTIDSAANTITITESNISDLGAYITATSTDTLQNKTIDTANNTITVNEADIADLQSYITASSTATLTNKTFDANGTGNSISNIETADFASAAFKDEDNMASDSATAVASQQSIKAYVDAEDANIASDSLTFTNKSGAISQWSNDTGYLVNTVEDTTPQLGGDLDLNSNNITGTGAINITGDITGTNIRATGNLTVDGTTTTLNTTNLSVEDAFIELNRNNSSTATDADAGIFIRNGYNGGGTDYNPAFYWDHGEQKFKFMITDVDPNTSPASLNDGTTTLANVSMGTLSAGPITASASTFYGITFRNNSGQDTLEIDQNNITGLRSNDDINITTAGTGTVNISSLTLPTGSTVTSILDEDTFSSNSDTALATQQSIKSYVDGQGFLTSVGGTISEGNSSVVVADSATGSVTVTLDGGTVAQFTDANGLTMSKNIAMGGNTITGLSTATPSADSDVANKKYVDDSLVGLVTAGSVDTFTNKTFDANGTGNSISNIEVADLAGSAVITAAETIAANDNDTTLPTSAAVKAYADSVAGLGNVVEDTTPQLGGDLDLNSNNITGTGDVSITGTIANEGISISGNNITATRSNDDVVIKASGTGRTVVEDVFYFAGDYTFNSTSGSYIQMGTDGEIVLNPNAAGNVTIGASSGATEETIQTGNNPLWLRAGKSDNGSAIIKINGSTSVGDKGYITLRPGDDNNVGSPTQGKVLISAKLGDSYLTSDTGKNLVLETYDNNQSIYLTPNGTGDVFAGNFRFDADQTVGAGQDNYVLTYDHSTGKISLEAASGGGGTITALNNQAENRLTTIGSTTTELDGEANLTFDGSTLAITGAMTATTSIANDAVSIDDNKITTTRSNDNLNIEANGTGQIQIKSAGGDFSNFSTLTSRYSNANIIYYENLSDTIGDGNRHYTNVIMQNNKLTSGQNSSNSNDRWRNLAMSKMDLNGSSSTATSTMYRSRGPMALEGFTIVDNSSATASTLGNASGGNYGVGIYPTGTGNMTITGTTGMGTYLDVNHDANMDITVSDNIGFKSIGIEHYGSGTGSFNITDHYGFYVGAHGDFSGTATFSLTNNYGYYFDTDTVGTNQYAFYSANDTAKSRVGTLERYREAINTLTSSASITVDCSLAPVHTVTLDTNATFTISNLGTGQTVTIIITQDVTGTRTGTFTGVKFPGGAPTLSTGNGDIDVVTIFNDGTNTLGNIAQAYA